MNSASSRAATLTAWVVSIATLAALCCGCSSQEGTLHMVSLDQRHDFQQTFSDAFIARDASGDADIVLFRDDIQPRRQDPDKPLTQDTCVLPRQLVHIRVFWKPMSGVKADHPANTNASIHWCLVCNAPDQSGVLEYSGSGLVDVDDTHDGATVRIRKAWMKAACRRGDVADPLGPSLLDGSFHAVTDPARVQAVLAEIKSAVAAPTQAQAGQPEVASVLHVAVARPD